MTFISNRDAVPDIVYTYSKLANLTTVGVSHLLNISTWSLYLASSSSYAVITKQEEISIKLSAPFIVTGQFQLNGIIRKKKFFFQHMKIKKSKKKNQKLLLVFFGKSLIKFIILQAFLYLIFLQNIYATFIIGRNTFFLKSNNKEQTLILGLVCDAAG